MVYPRIRKWRYGHVPHRPLGVICRKLTQVLDRFCLLPYWLILSNTLFGYLKITTALANGAQLLGECLPSATEGVTFLIA